VVTSLIRRATCNLASERGSLLVEVLVAAVLVAVMGAALFGALDSSAKVSGIAKTRAGAAALAQDDQERMRAMPIVALNNMRQHRDPVVVGKIAYVVDSRADWIADKSGTTDCTDNGKAADYLKITTTVTAKNVPGLKPVVVTSTVTPAPGTFQSNQGSLAVTVIDRNAKGVPGVSVTINGPTTASDVTDANGCAFFGYEPSGSYDVTASALNYVDPNGNAQASGQASISASQVSTLQLSYDLAGQATVNFRTTPAGRPEQDSAQHYVGFANAGVTVNLGTRAFGTGNPANPITTTQTLFPFTSPYSVFAGGCANNNPLNNGATATSLLVDPGRTDYAVTVPVPSLNIKTQLSGVDTGNMAVKVTSATPGCAAENWPQTSLTTAGLVGLLPDPGLPYGSYNVCVSGKVGTTTRRTTTVVSPTGTTQPIALNPTNATKTYVFNVTSGSTSGACP
jgi:Tfp pilus assembly protein PilV